MFHVAVMAELDKVNGRRSDSELRPRVEPLRLGSNPDQELRPTHAGYLGRLRFAKSERYGLRAAIFLSRETR